MRQVGGGSANRRVETTLHIPAFMQAKQYTCAKCIACTSGPFDVLLRQLQGRLPEILSSSCTREPTFWKVDNYQFTNTQL